MSNSLVLVTEVERRLARISTIPEVREDDRRLGALAVYARMSIPDHNRVMLVRALVQRRGGELVKAIPRVQGKTGQGLLPTLGRSRITWSMAQRWERLLALSVAELRRLVAERTDQGQRITLRQLLVLADARRVNGDKCPESTLTGDARFNTIVADPPWDWSDEGDNDQKGRGRPDYATIPFERLLTLSVAGKSIIERALDNAHCYLWTTNRSLPKSFALLRAWGFRYVTALVWVKPSFGMGTYFRGQHEHLLFGVRGSLALLRQDVGTVIAAPRGAEHSAKPDAAYALIESCSPAPRLELFGAGPRAGWTVWGGRG